MQGRISFVFTKVRRTENGVSEATGKNTESSFSMGIVGLEPSNSQISKSSINNVNCADLLLLNSNPASQILASDFRIIMKIFIYQILEIKTLTM